MSRLFRALRNLQGKHSEHTQPEEETPVSSVPKKTCPTKRGMVSSSPVESVNALCFLGSIGTEPLRCSLEEVAAIDAGCRGGKAADYAMMYVIAGRGRVRRVGSRWENVDRGTIVQFVPENVYDVEFESDKKIKLAELHLPVAAWELLVTAEPVLEFLTSFGLGLQVSIVRQFEELVETMKDAGSDVFPLGVLSEAMQLVASLHDQGLANHSIPKTQLAVCTACRRLSANPCDRIRIPDLAKELGVGHTQFRLAFKELVGVAPGDYQIRRRIDLARQVMREEPKIAVSELAERLGYPDIHSFSKQFKRVVKMTPSAYAKSLG